MSTRSPFVDAVWTALPLSDAMRCESTLAYLTYRAGYLIHLLSVIKELLDFISPPEDLFMMYQEEVRQLRSLSFSQLQLFLNVCVDLNCCRGKTHDIPFL